MVGNLKCKVLLMKNIATQLNTTKKLTMYEITNKNHPFLLVKKRVN